MTTRDKARITAVHLAGGASRGLGSPKQLVRFEGKTLIRRTAEFLLASGCDDVVVVLGAVIDPCRREIEDLDVAIVVNANWSVGISSSIRTGIEALAPGTDAALIALSDQPFVTSEDYARLAAAFREGDRPIVAARHGDIVGVPAVFSSELFSDLTSLNADQGARYLLRNRPEIVSSVDMASAAFDVDTPADAERLAQLSD